jgi:RNA polymerase sigma-70 factor (ECF subfamily)
MPAEAMTFADRAESEPERIARGLRQRDLALLAGLVERYQYRLVRYLVYLLGRRDQVEDLVQETWLRVLERGRQYDCRFRFEPWLFAIARHLALDHLRARQAVSLGGLDTAAGEVASCRAATDPSPFEVTARNLDAARVARCLDTLEPVCREALLLRFQEEMSLQEIARIVQAPLTTVSSRIYRGLAALRARLAEEEDTHGRT